MGSPESWVRPERSGPLNRNGKLPFFWHVSSREPTRTLPERSWHFVVAGAERLRSARVCVRRFTACAVETRLTSASRRGSFVKKQNMFRFLCAQREQMGGVSCPDRPALLTSTKSSTSAHWAV